MENKYYTPEISELHVGLDFEYVELRDAVKALKYNIDVDKDDDWWNAATISDLKEYWDLVDEFSGDYIPLRIKYLDRDDIEELGWSRDFNEDGEEQPNLFDEHGYSNAYCIDRQLTPSKTAYILHFFTDQFVVIDSIFDCGSGKENMLFRGYIKNKSELRKIMEMVGIKNE